jgi:hypothetical protein
LSPIIFRILNIRSPLPNFIITTLPFKSFHHILNTKSVFSHKQNHANSQHIINHRKNTTIYQWDR